MSSLQEEAIEALQHSWNEGMNEAPAYFYIAKAIVYALLAIARATWAAR